MVLGALQSLRDKTYFASFFFFFFKSQPKFQSHLIFLRVVVSNTFGDFSWSDPTIGKS